MTTKITITVPEQADTEVSYSDVDYIEFNHVTNVATVHFIDEGLESQEITLSSISRVKPPPPPPAG